MNSVPNLMLTEGIFTAIGTMHTSHSEGVEESGGKREIWSVGLGGQRLQEACLSAKKVLSNMRSQCTFAHYI